MNMTKTISIILFAILSIGLVLGNAYAGNGNAPKGTPFIAINDQIIAVQGEVSDLQDQIESIVAQVDTIEDRVGANQAAIADLVAVNAHLSTLVNANSTDIDQITAEITTLQQEVENLYLASGDNSDAIAENEALIANLQAAVLAVENGLVALDTDLQGQIDNNLQLITVLQNQIATIQDQLTFQQNLANGSCPGGTAVVNVRSDGSYVCDSVGSGSGGLSTQSVYNTFWVDPGGSVGAYASCPSNTLAIGGGWFGPDVGAGGVIARDEPSGDSYSVIFRNFASYTTYIRVQALCADL